MHEATFVASAVQAILAGHFAWILARGATSSARKLLARILLELCGYAVGLGLGTWVGPYNANLIGVPIGLLAFFDLTRFARWCAAGAHVESAPPSSRGPFLGCAAIVGGLVLLALWKPAHVFAVFVSLAVVALVLLLWSLFAFAVATRRRIVGARGYFWATVAPTASAISSIGLFLGAPIPIWLHTLLLRDLALLMFEFLLLMTYLDSGHEPISLRKRVVSGMLVAILALGTVAAHLVIPLASDPVEAHSAAVRLILIIVVSVISVVVVAPIIFQRSVLGPLEVLLAGLTKAEAGERVVLPIDRRDELGRVGRAFNTMVAALADDRASLRARLLDVQSRRAEIESLNEELRRQVAARSRQLSQLISQIDRSSDHIEVGSTVDDRYLIEDQLGAGAMGIVFSARRISDQRRFALKTIIGGSHDVAVRFTREAEIAATVHHPHVVSIFDVGIYRNAPYLVMEYLSQGTLADAQDRFGDLPWLLPLLENVASGLCELHARGILHRDLKPANILLDGDPVSPIAKIGDLGIARSDLSEALAATAQAESGERSAGGTAPNALLGTYPYMAPELAFGALAYGAHSDMFSFGVLAWEVCNGALPFSVPPIVSAMSGLPLQKLPPMSDAAPIELVTLLERCLARETKERPTAEEAASTLREALSILPRGSALPRSENRVSAFMPTARDES